MPFESPLVPHQWLLQKMADPNLKILDASVPKVGQKAENNTLNNQFIQSAQYLDLNGKFSDLTTELPHMMPSARQFEREVQRLGINRKDTIVIYDNLGVYSSPRVWWMFKAMGHQKVFVLDGGLPGWVAGGLPTQTVDQLEEEKGDFKVTHNKDYFTDANYVLKHLDNPDVAILDARSKGRFEGIEEEPRKGLRKGHIPRSISLPFEHVLNGDYMKSKPELESLFARLGIHGKELIFSCGSGLTTCIILLAAYISGYERLKVYDGSWSEWGLPSSLPIEV